MKKIRSVLNPLLNARRRLIYHGLFRKFQRHTMVPKHLFIANLEIMNSFKKVPGCVVECGVWRGGAIAASGFILGASRHYFLFDSFEGLPIAKEIDGESARRWQDDPSGPCYHNNCTASIEDATKAMEIAGIGKYEIVPGWFEETLPGFRTPEPIAVLRLDADWYDSTKTCLSHLFDQVLPGGVVLIDDYYTWDGCSRAVHDFLSARSSTERIHSHSGVCYIIKR